MYNFHANSKVPDSLNDLISYSTEVYKAFRMDLVGYSKGIGVNNARKNVHDAHISVQG